MSTTTKAPDALAELRAYLEPSLETLRATVIAFETDAPRPVQHVDTARLDELLGELAILRRIVVGAEEQIEALQARAERMAERLRRAEKAAAGVAVTVGQPPAVPSTQRLNDWLGSIGFKLHHREAGAFGPPLLETHLAIAVVDPGEMAFLARVLHGQLRQQGIDLQPVGSDFPAPYLQASYDPATGVATLDLVNVHDGMLPPGLGEAPTAQEGA